MSTCKIYFGVLTALFFFPKLLIAQCPITVDAGPDKFACAVGGTVNLEGEVSGTFLGFAWTPTTGLSNPNSLTPTATVTGPVTYTLTAQAVDPGAANLVTNPGFEAGNSGFSSSYNYNPMPITPGTYTITTSPSLVLASFPPCDDHTFGNGTGNMMLINGNASTGAQAWCQTIPVAANTWYVLGAWAMASPITPPALQFSVNGTAVGSAYPVGSGSCNWQELSATWYSGAATTATLCILDQITGGNAFFGDDYALDDIYMAAACSVSDQVEVGVANVNAALPPTAVLPCNAAQSGIVIDATPGSTTGPNYTYNWDGPGIVNGATTPTVTVNEVGTYTLTISLGSCSDMASIEVLSDPNVVVANANALEDLNCENATVQLDGTGTSVGATIGYVWSPASGIIFGQGTLSPTVSQPGTYLLTVTNSISGCTATATTFVGQNTTPPVAVASAPSPLSCSATTVTLSGTGSSTGPNFTYNWTGPGIVSGANQLNNAVVNAPGTYLLTVTNAENGCTAADTAVVVQSGALPIASATASGSLSCSQPTVTLGSTGSSNGPGITVGWATPNGHFTSSVNGPTATVDSAGTYILTITNTSNGCSATDTMSVSANFALPTVGIASPFPVLNCLVDSVQLNATQSSSGSGFGLVWASQIGTFLTGNTTLMPWVGGAGTYVLTITNTASGCTASASATVTENSTPPNAQAGPNATLDCDGTAIPLSGNGSSIEPGISYQWTTTGGNITSGDTTLLVQVDGIGTYFLTVENAVNGCSALDSVTVSQDANAPTVQIDPPGQLDCDTDQVTLDASGSSAGANITLTWSGPGFVSGQSTYSPTVNAPGVYSLLLLNQTNNCEATASVTVTQNLTPPVADAGPDPDVEDCVSNGSQALDGSGSSQGAAFSYLWSNGETSPLIIVQNPGIYYLSITDNSNGCTAVDNVLVEGIDTIPTIMLVPPDTLSCLANEVQIVLNGNLNSNYVYGWENFSGQNGIVSGGGTLTPTVNQPGIYALHIFNENTGCVWYYQVQVLQSYDHPNANAGAPQTLLCGQANLQLDGTGSSSGAGFSYAWSTQNGNILNGENTPTPTVNAPGTYVLTVTDGTSGCSATDAVTVGQDANAPVALAGAPQPLTCSVQAVTLDGTGSSSGPGINYLWTSIDGNIVTGASTLAPTVNAPGTYLLTVTNTLNNCQTLASVQVLDLTQQPDAIVAMPQPLGCNLLTTTLDATGSSMGLELAYLWTGPGITSGATTLLPLVNAPGVYTLAVTNTSTGCVTFAQVTVVEDNTPPIALAAAPQDLDCMTQTVTLSGMGSSTGAGFGYWWTGPGIVGSATTLSPTVNVAGIYTLTVTSQANGCTATASVILTENTVLPTAVAAAPQNLDCIAQQVALSGAGSSTGAGFGYLWAGPGIVSGGTTLTPTVDEPGVYTLVVMDMGNGCTATATAMVNQTATPPTVFAAAPQILTCLQNVVSLSGQGSSSGTGVTYLWIGPGIVVGETSLQPVVNQPGVYNLTVTDQNSGCTATAQVTVMQDVAPPVAAAGPPLTLACGQDAVTLQGSSNASNVNFTWFSLTGGFVGSNNLPNPVVNAIGTYILQVNNLDNGCSAVDSTVVTAMLGIFPEPEIGSPTCANPVGSVAFSGGQGGAAPFQFSMDGGLNFTQETSFEDLPPGDYEFLVQDALGCETTMPVVIAPSASLVISLAASVSAALNEPVQFTPVLNIPASEVATVNWSPSDGLSCTDCLNPLAMPQEGTTYTVTVTSVDGCTSSASVVLDLTILDGSIYIPNVFSPNGDGINDVLTVFADEKQVVQVISLQVFTRWGEPVFAQFGFAPNDIVMGWDGTFRGKEVDLGIYAWFAEVELASGGRMLLKGDLTVVR